MKETKPKLLNTREIYIPWKCKIYSWVNGNQGFFFLSVKVLCDCHSTCQGEDKQLIFVDWMHKLWSLVVNVKYLNGLCSGRWSTYLLLSLNHEARSKIVSEYFNASEEIQNWDQRRENTRKTLGQEFVGWGWVGETNLKVHRFKTSLWSGRINVQFGEKIESIKANKKYLWK